MLITMELISRTYSVDKSSPIKLFDLIDINIKLMGLKIDPNENIFDIYPFNEIGNLNLNESCEVGMGLIVKRIS